MSPQLLQHPASALLILAFSFLEAEETLLIDIATNSKFHEGTGVAKDPVREQPLVLVLPSSLPPGSVLVLCSNSDGFPSDIIIWLCHDTQLP